MAERKDICSAAEGARTMAEGETSQQPSRPWEGDKLSRLAGAFKALSDETRLKILRSLMQSNGALCECDIVDLSDLSQPTISYHLRVLREAGLIVCQKRGLWTYCSLNEKRLLELVSALAGLA